MKKLSGREAVEYAEKTGLENTWSAKDEYEYMAAERRKQCPEESAKEIAQAVAYALEDGSVLADLGLTQEQAEAVCEIAKAATK